MDGDWVQTDGWHRKLLRLLLTSGADTYRELMHVKEVRTCVKQLHHQVTEEMVEADVLLRDICGVVALYLFNVERQRTDEEDQKTLEKTRPSK